MKNECQKCHRIKKTLTSILGYVLSSPNMEFNRVNLIALIHKVLGMLDEEQQLTKEKNDSL